MTILIVIAVAVVALVVLYLFVFSSRSIGPRYKKYLQETQRSLLLSRFPQLTDGDLYDIQTTSAGDLVRWILQQEYNQLYIQKQYQVLEKLMDTAMENAGDYSAINEWINGRVTKQDAIYSLDKRDPDNYRLIFKDTLSKILRIYRKEPTRDLANFYINRGYDKVGNVFDRDFKGAIQDFNKAIELAPNYAWAYLGRGSVKYSMGDNEGAIQDCNKAIQLDPNDAHTYYKRGLAKIGLGQKDSGCRDLSKAAELGYSAMANSAIKEHCK